jgi:hypothetical protein
MTFEPGIYTEAQIPMAVYCADDFRPEPTLSSGVAFTMLSESPMHAYHRHPRLGGRRSDDTQASDFGTLAHSLLLGGEARICEVVADDWRTKAAKEQRDLARANGLVPILAHHMGAVRRMVDAAHEFIAGSEISGIFESGAAEQTVIARDGDVWLRARPDWLNDEICLSFKTSKADIAPRPFRRLMSSMGYDFSLAFYSRALRLVEPQKKRRHVILAQQQDFPHACALYDLTEIKATIEEAKVEAAIELWQRCLKTNTWPGFSPRVQSIDAAPWELAETEVSYA